jgi:tetratricopeptide (TPR) repeat protein
MRPNEISQPDFEAIEQYLNNELDEPSRLALELRMEKDAAFADEVEGIRKAIQGVELAFFRKSLALDVESSKQATAKTAPLWLHNLKWISAVAALAIGIVLALWWWRTRQPIVIEDYYSQYFRPEPGLAVPMGVAESPRFAEAMTQYKLGDYDSALRSFQNLLSQKPNSDTLLYFIASAQLNRGKAVEAAATFKQVLNMRDSKFFDDALWYAALAALKQGRVDDCARALLKMPDHSPYHQDAQALLKALKK